MNNATLQPPPEREFPPGRHGSLREEILRDVRRRPRRTLRLRHRLVPLVAAAAVLLVVSLAVAIPQLVRPEPKPIPALSPNPSPTASATIPGFSASQLTAVRDSCVTGAQKERKGPADLGRKLAKDVVDLDSLRLYNATTNEDGTVALLGNGTQLVVCSWHAVNRKSSLPPVARLQGVGYYAHAQWLPGAVSVDASGGSESGGKSYMQLLGRVPSGVTEVEIVLNEGTDKEATTRVKVVDGTYAATLKFEIYNEGWPIPTVRTFDASGTKRGEVGGRNENCFVAPDGTVVSGGTRSDPVTCKEATPWR